MNNTDFLNSYQQALDKVKALVQETNKRSVLIVLQDIVDQNKASGVSSIRESLSNIICIITVSDGDTANEVLFASKGIIDELLIDSDNIRLNSTEIKDAYISAAIKCGIPHAFYSDIDSWISSSVNYMKCIEGDDLSKKSVLFLGKNPLATHMIISLVKQNIHVNILDCDYSSMLMPFTYRDELEIKSDMINILPTSDIRGCCYDIVIGCSLKANYLHLDALEDLKMRSAYDIGIKNFSKEFISQRPDTKFYRSDDRAGIASVVINIMETDYLVGHNLGRVSFAGLNVVSGGCIGNDGDIVVDNAFNPTVVLGVANGDGTFKNNLSDIERNNIKKINSII